MPFTLTSLTDLPGGQQVETHPTISLGRYADSVAGGALVYLNQQGAPSSDWLIGVRSIVSWWFRVSGLGASPGITFRIDVCTDPGLMPFTHYRWYPIPVSSTSSMLNLVLPGIAARFCFQNAHAVDGVTVVGHVKIQGGF